METVTLEVGRELESCSISPMPLELTLQFKERICDLPEEKAFRLQIDYMSIDHTGSQSRKRYTVTVQLVSIENFHGWPAATLAVLNQ